MDAFLHDLRYGLRALRRQRGPWVVAILTLALAIGANTAIFSLVDGVLLRPLPYPEPERVTRLGWEWKNGGYAQALSRFKFEYWARNAETLEGVAAYKSARVRVGEGPSAEVASALRVSGDYFRVVGIAPSAGRPFAGTELAPGGPEVALVGESFRERRGGGVAPGDVLTLNGVPHTVVGVVPDEARPVEYGSAPDVWLPWRFEADPADQGHNDFVIARRAEGVSEGEMRAAMAVLSERFRADHPELAEEGEGVMLFGYLDPFVSGAARTGLWVLLGAVGAILLIACANVSHMLLARAAERRREIALRASLGADRRRLFRQLLTESLALGLVAGALGLLLGVWTLDALTALLPWELPRVEQVGLDGRMLGFTLAVSLFTVLLFGTAAALPASRADLRTALSAGGRTAAGAGGGRGRGRFRHALAVVQTALSVLLLAGAGLFVVSFLNLRGHDLGFEPDRLAAVYLEPVPGEAPSPEEAVDVAERTRRALAELPGVEAAAVASSAPLRRGLNIPVTIEGPGVEPLAQSVEWRGVSPEYFRALGVEVLAGRTFGRNEGAPVVVVNEELARRLGGPDAALAARAAIGRFRGEWVLPGLPQVEQPVLGVVRDVREVSPDEEPRPTVYVAADETPAGLLSIAGPYPVLLVRTATGATPAAALRRRALEQVPSLRGVEVASVAEYHADVLARPRTNALLMALFAALALAITGAGLYGVVAYGVSRRLREIGIRRAVGAEDRHILRGVLAPGAVAVGLGLGLGLGGAAAARRVVESLLFEVGPLDPRILVAVALFLLGITALATWIPARAALRTDPMSVLRQE